MHTILFPPSELPSYHKNMLIMRLRPSAGLNLAEAMTGSAFASLGLPRGYDPLARTAGVGAATKASTQSGPAVAVAAPAAAVPFEVVSLAPPPPGSQGLSELDALVRAGLVKRIVSLAPRAEPQRRILESLGPVAMAVGTPADYQGSSRLKGTSLIELTREQDAMALQDALARDPDVEFVGRVPIRYLALARLDPRRKRAPSSKAHSAVAENATTAAAPMAIPPSPNAMWNLRKIRWDAVRRAGLLPNTEAIKIAILDTGVDASHPDLSERVVKYQFLHPDFPNASGPKDYHGHGTHVAGTIAARFDNEVGVNGICNAQLLIWKIFTDQPTLHPLGTHFTYVVDPVMYRRALADCLDEGVDVMNLSIGGAGEPDFQEAQLFRDLLDTGTTIVAAMGNHREAGSPTMYPAAISGVIGVGATSLADTIAFFSNRGSYISLCAPGVAIWSTLPVYDGQTGFYLSYGPTGPVQGKPIRRETTYDAWDGTSMAAPHISAAAALLLARRGPMPPAEVRRALMQTADRLSAMGAQEFDHDYGSGRLNLERLLAS